MTEQEKVLVDLAKTVVNCDDAACRHACLNAIAYIKEHTTKWVSAKDGLPADEATYLCIASGNSPTHTYKDAWLDLVRCVDGWLYPDDPDADLEVSYWMAYPDPPTGGVQ